MECRSIFVGVEDSIKFGVLRTTEKSLQSAFPWPSGKLKYTQYPENCSFANCIRTLSKR